MRSDMIPGAIFPDYEFSDHTAKRRKLSELQGQHPLVLVLSRGGFCPKDRRQAEGLVQLYRELEVAYCRLVTISTDNITETSEYRSGVGAHWPFLSDAGRIVQKDLDIAEYTDPLHNPMIPHVIVLEPGLVIYKIYNGYWFFGRPTLEDLRQDLRAVLKKFRPDWDITTPELREAWQKGRKELFYPYGKRSSRLSANRISRGIAIRCAMRRDHQAALMFSSPALGAAMFDLKSSSSRLPATFTSKLWLIQIVMCRQHVEHNHKYSYVQDFPAYFNSARDLYRAKAALESIK